MILILRSIHWQDRWRLDMPPAKSLDRKANVLTQSCRSEQVPSWGQHWCVTERRASDLGLHSYRIWTVMLAMGWLFHCASLLQLWALGTFMELFTCLSFYSFWTGSSTAAFHMFLQSEDLAASSQYLLNACFGWDFPILRFFVCYIFYVSQTLRLSIAEMTNIHKSQ